MRSLLGFLVLFALPLASARADITWVGSVSDDVFDEANWDLSQSPVTAVDPAVTIFDNVRIAGAPAPVDIEVPGIQSSLQVGDGFVLIVDGSTVFTSGNDGISGQPGSANGPTIRVVNGGDVATYFISQGTHMVIGPGSSAHLAGPATPINNSTIDLTYGALLACTQETVADFLAEHLHKISVDGAPAVVGANVTVVSDGGTGCRVEVLPQATATERNGIGVNPQDFHTITQPVLGSFWDCQVASPPPLGATLVAIGFSPSAPPPATTPLPFGPGELLIGLAPFPILDVVGGSPPSGTHSIMIPNDVALEGAMLYTQAIRVEVVPGVDIVATALNAIDLLLGH